jgi:hypothetical protein
MFIVVVVVVIMVVVVVVPQWDTQSDPPTPSPPTYLNECARDSDYYPYLVRCSLLNHPNQWWFRERSELPTIDTGDTLCWPCCSNDYLNVLNVESTLYTCAFDAECWVVL